MLYKRTLILNDINTKSSQRKGVITLENTGSKIKGILRLYNFEDYPKAAAIGITNGEEIVKVPLNSANSFVEFDILQGLDLQEKISCALVDICDLTRPKIIIGGTSNYLNDWADRVEQAFFERPKVLPREELYESSPAEIESEISTVLREDREYTDCDKCKECKYKKAFFENVKPQSEEALNTSSTPLCESENLTKIKEILSNATLLEDSNTQSQDQDIVSSLTNMQSDNVKSELNASLQEVNNNQDKPEEESFDDSFYYQIKEQIDELFATHTREETLESLIPGSQWTKVEYEDVDGYYVIGLVYDGEELLFISYGLPADNPSSPPPDLVEYAQWLPLTENNDGPGYWLVYQSAKNGESIKIE